MGIGRQTAKEKTEVVHVETVLKTVIEQRNAKKSHSAQYAE